MCTWFGKYWTESAYFGLLIFFQCIFLSPNWTAIHNQEKISCKKKKDLSVIMSSSCFLELAIQKWQLTPSDSASEEFDQTIFPVDYKRSIGPPENLALNLVKDAHRYLPIVFLIFCLFGLKSNPLPLLKPYLPWTKKPWSCKLGQDMLSNLVQLPVAGGQVVLWRPKTIFFCLISLLMVHFQEKKLHRYIKLHLAVWCLSNWCYWSEGN